MSAQASQKTPSEFDTEPLEDRRGRVDPKAFRKLSSRIFRYKLLLISGLSLILLGTFAALLGPYLFGRAIDDALRPHRMDLLVRFAWIYLATECIRALATIAHNYFFALLGQKVMQDLRLAVMSHLLRLPIRVYDHVPVGRLVTRVTNDISALADMFSSGFASIFSNVLVVSGILVWLFILDFKLALIAVSAFPLLLITAAYLSGKLKIAYGEIRNRLSALNAFLAENILGIQVVTLFNRQKAHLEKFKQISNHFAEAQTASVRVFAMLQPSITWCTGISLGLVIAFGATAAYHGQIKVGLLVSFYTYILALFQPVREIADKWNIFLSGMSSADRIFAILSWNTETPESALASPDERSASLGSVSSQDSVPSANRMSSDPTPLKFKGHIRFENVWFAYEGREGSERWILKDFSLEILPGMTVGIVGHTGSGKTTLISLLLRFYEPQKGRITLDGKDIREIDRRSLRQALGIVQQDVFLFSGSMNENITLWKSDRKVPAPVQSQVDAMLAQGTELDERGSNLSMGQRQVISFARAWSAKPSVWILDEASANIDSETESLLETSLQTASQGQTRLIIAHRLATVREADLIIVLNQGVLVESGTHSQLLQHAGLYARLYRYQAALQPGVLG